jgi:tetratricopeptide (TPR) repeat protein
MLKSRTLVRFLGAAALPYLMAMSGPAYAWDVTPGEFAMLPPYCDAKMNGKSQEAINYWRAQLGHDNWIHMHHYCGGLNDMNRYYRQDAKGRRESLRRVVWEMTYMLDHTKPDFYMRADMHYYRGKAHQLSGRNGEALTDLVKALELRPDMPLASIELAELYKKLGKKGSALDALKTALEKNPSHKGLRRTYQEMGGDLAAIPETPKVDVAPAASLEAAQKPESAQAKDADPAPANAGVPASGTAAPTGTEQAAEPKIGSPTNPYCRFCPD